MSRMPLVVGNWKMHTSQEEAVNLAHAVAADASVAVELVVAPPFPWLVTVADVLRGSGVMVAAQNCWTENAGAFTGEVSPSMLANVCRFVIVGHSERRRLFGESDELIREKATAALSADILPIICVGETIETRQAGDATSFVASQVVHALGNRTDEEIEHCIVAYEPIWAIGTGIAATPHDAEEMALAIRRTVRGVAGPVAESIRILYGGSVTAENAGGVFGGANVDGALVGGASLNPESFLAIAVAKRR